ncbi:hypothetical protein SAMN05421837_12152 [Amycolatopsis pretoriensis]|uniref:DUF3592 domain-containing protein n=1 Tax=Amycolatopsis pretoriensis TaxID=218821 RepID=A0A1H5RLP1_9PSEU|nr:DUF3592 domain-containing protein [Amycolatopsis pretoriensis]SEF38421.1 hypothetical protein SAMN05421837_12152 [Amycolatopsis pretoriensis]
MFRFTTVFSRPDRRAGWRLWLLGVPTTLAWAAAGWSGALGLLDGFRLMSLNRVDAWGADANPEVSIMLFFAAAITVASSLGFAMMWAAVPSVDRMGTGFRVSSLTTALGVALGSGVAIPSWTPPEAVGQRLPFLDGKAEPWSDVDWVVYYEPYLVPAVSALVALVLIVLLLQAFLTEAESDDREQALRHRGREVTGFVTHVEFTDVWVMGHPKFVVHVRFPAETGERTVVTTMVTPLFQAPCRGSAVRVRYDPQDPEAVLVEPDPTGSLF